MDHVELFSERGSIQELELDVLQKLLFVRSELLVGSGQKKPMPDLFALGLLNTTVFNSKIPLFSFKL